MRVREAGGDLDLAQESLAANDEATSGSSVFTATWRLRRVSSATYTVAMPPRPSSRSTVYRPASTVPGWIFMDAGARRACL